MKKPRLLLPRLSTFTRAAQQLVLPRQSVLFVASPTASLLTILPVQRLIVLLHRPVPYVAASLMRHLVTAGLPQTAILPRPAPPAVQPKARHSVIAMITRAIQPVTFAVQPERQLTLMTTLVTQSVTCAVQPERFSIIMLRAPARFAAQPIPTMLLPLRSLFLFPTELIPWRWERTTFFLWQAHLMATPSQVGLKAP